MSNIDMQTYVKGKEGIDLVELDGDLVMMDLEQGIYFAMNEQASEIWKRIQKEVRVKEVADEIRQLYEVSEEVCDKHVLAFIKTLDEAHLIGAY